MLCRVSLRKTTEAQIGTTCSDPTKRIILPSFVEGVLFHFSEPVTVGQHNKSITLKTHFSAVVNACRRMHLEGADHIWRWRIASFDLEVHPPAPPASFAYRDSITVQQAESRSEECSLIPAVNEQGMGRLSLFR